jgi:CBS-domain-containing membrane protein
LKTCLCPQLAAFVCPEIDDDAIHRNRVTLNKSGFDEMTRSINKMFEEFKRYWKNYVFQCLLATFVVFIVLLALSLKNAVIIASIGATAFIIFAMPGMVTAKPRNVIGGHAAGLIIGSLCFLIPHSTVFYAALSYSLAVGLAIFIMVVIDTEHPPAAATALGFAISGFSLKTAIALVLSIVVLSLVHYFFRQHLKDLT